MKGIETDYTEMRKGRVNRNEWESLLGRLDAVGNEIDRAMGWATRIEEPGGGAGLSALQKLSSQAAL
jgi:hypothetical protein